MTTWMRVHAFCDGDSYSPTTALLVTPSNAPVFRALQGREPAYTGDYLATLRADTPMGLIQQPLAGQAIRGASFDVAVDDIDPAATRGTDTPALCGINLDEVTLSLGGRLAAFMRAESALFPGMPPRSPRWPALLRHLTENPRLIPGLARAPALAGVTSLSLPVAQAADDRERTVTFLFPGVRIANLSTLPEDAAVVFPSWVHQLST